MIGFEGLGDGNVRCWRRFISRLPDGMLAAEGSTAALNPKP